jgi:hypothetical protein
VDFSEIIATQMSPVRAASPGRWTGGSRRRSSAVYDDNFEYRIKIAERPEHKVLFNELLGVVVAEVVGVRVPPSEIVEVEAGLLKDNLGLPVPAGAYFASRLLNDHSELPNDIEITDAARNIDV